MAEYKVLQFSDPEVLHLFKSYIIKFLLACIIVLAAWVYFDKSSSLNNKVPAAVSEKKSEKKLENEPELKSTTSTAKTTSSNTASTGQIKKKTRKV
ncbi:hypothetical protein B5S28_g3090 [[Candida] boidinii]|uniref:Unnamed protein product n=1 Tax=Candida boidinii TaxID=5477 RepID=A0ACB5TTR7_CANBO|nr:hypothetical protein B5S28_g3090 [[Candida] boidinii]OWB62952.1 hypothetical protein B5S29_g3903 [[Candida] boidinii]OWB73750.1 hypothetical protein B5S31_g3510 [[Candida] boidinii]OWB79877.1 hypothetical protein B5S32_g4116 [[Candida] boidinii]GME94617.1 unnamed protein product [[Candida] boidinii]